MAMHNTDANKERRRTRRLKVDFTLTYQVDHPLVVRMSVGWNHNIYALMLDLSEDGMAISTDFNIPSATILSIKFTLINLNAVTEEERIKSMELVGEVRYNIPSVKGEHRLGIKFTQIAPIDKDAIVNFVKTALINKPESA
jgi:c-di-GMP-binding flagellar brake protein YcgR